MTEKKLHKALVAVCGKVENVKRDTQGQAGGAKYKYATIDAVLDVVQPLLLEHGLALVQYVRGDSLISELHHEGGEVWDMGEYNLGTFIDSQKRGSAITYGRRYQLCSIFGIAQEDDDGAADVRSKPVMQEHQSKSVLKTKTDREKFKAELIKLMDSAPDLGELKAVWDDAEPTLKALKASDNEDDNRAYTYLLSAKDLAKSSILAFQSIQNIQAD